MIKLEIQPLPKEAADKVRSWLDRPEAGIFKECLLALVHQNTSDATNLSMKRPFDRLTNEELPSGAQHSIAEAARWKIVLDGINELSRENSTLTSITSTSYSHARHD